MKDLALELLVIEGYVRVEQDGQAIRHYLDRPFADPETAPCPTVPQPCPGTDGVNRAPVPPPLRGHEARAPQGRTPEDAQPGDDPSTDADTELARLAEKLTDDTGEES